MGLLGVFRLKAVIGFLFFTGELQHQEIKVTFSRKSLTGILHVKNLKRLVKCLSEQESLQRAQHNRDQAESTAQSPK